jgi:Uncharacterized proteins of PilT N-term./Vapc superfamily
MTRKIILDTNFLTAPFQLDTINIFQEIQRIYPQSTVYTIDDALQEAKSIEQGKYKDLVQKLIKEKNIEVLETEGKGNVDDLLVKISSDYVIATNDKELKERVIEANAEVLHIRNQSYIEVLNSKDQYSKEKKEK